MIFLSSLPFRSPFVPLSKEGQFLPLAKGGKEGFSDQRAFVVHDVLNVKCVCDVLNVVT